MKLLYISNRGEHDDYLRDMVFHGLRTLLGPDVVDVKKIECMYQGADLSKVRGRGFTLYGLLPDIPTDRSDIFHKLRSKYFDAVIYGSIWRSLGYLHQVVEHYGGPSLVFLDGEDWPEFEPTTSSIKALLFKRELYQPSNGCLPIQFAIPREKILQEPPPKTRIMAPMDPTDPSTYIYTDEASYYRQYAESFYAKTTRKAGWDCLRHYEIMANWAIPYFLDIDHLPETTCVHLPRLAMKAVKKVIEQDRHKEFIPIYNILIPEVMNNLRTYLTTEALATYVLDKITCNLPSRVSASLV